MSLNEEYTERYNKYLKSLASTLEEHITDALDGMPRIDRVTARAKGIDSFLKKAMKTNDDGEHKYSYPLRQVQDQIGARIITFYLDDVDAVSGRIENYFQKIESKLVVPDTDKTFGYFGKHYILLIPTEILPQDVDKNKLPMFFELQIKTLFQHAWGEAEHDLGYKSINGLSSEETRMIAFTSAQAWGADKIFNDLHNAANSE